MTGSGDVAELWVRRFHPIPDAQVKLICLPHAGGSASFYFSLSRSLFPTVDVLAIQYPGRQDRLGEKCIDTIEELADSIFQIVRAQADRPLILFGHSMGAILAFEVARRLEGDSIIPMGLFASARRAPRLHRDEKVHQRDDEGLLADIRELSGTNSGLFDDDELLSIVLPSIRSDYKAVETYRYQPGPMLSCPIFALVGDNDPKSTVDEAGAWKEHTSGKFELVVFSGGHFYIHSSLPTVLDIIMEHINSTGGCVTGSNPGYDSPQQM